MKTLFLTSYFAGVSSLFKDFIIKRHLDKTVLFIPTAGKVEEYTGYIDEAKTVFDELQFKVDMLDLTEVSQELARKKISQTSCLYISGGNTFYLLQELKRKDLLPLIHERIDQGMIYIGESAGAIIAARDIDYSKLMDDPAAAEDLSDTGGLKEVDFYPVPHAGEEPFADSAQVILDTYSDQIQLLPLTNSQAVVVEGDKVEVREVVG